MAIPARPVVRGPADAPTSVVIQALEAVDAGERPLVVDEGSGQLAAHLHARGAEPQVWRRFAGRGDTAAPWPQVESATSAFVRLGKDRRALAMALHAAAGVVAPGAIIVLFGANAEGVKSAGKALEEVAEGVITVDTRRHSRVLAGRRRAEISGLRTTLESWREVHEITLNGRARPWVSYPGVFAGGALDPGTALLLEHLPPLSGAVVLDMACGSGIIGAAVREQFPEAAVDLVDNDAVAIAAARENVPGGSIICGDGLAAAPRPRYDVILSNPPIHDGVAESLAFLQGLIAEAPARLKPGGVLQVVIQSRIRAVQPWFEAAFKETAVVAQDRRYQIIRGVAGSIARANRRGAR
jgi:16S rRNA (guanine1207-N2)-methyltransferase